MSVFSTATFKAYVEENKEEFIEAAYLGFKSSDFLTHHPGNKGKMTTQDITYNTDPISDWKQLTVSDFTQKGDVSTLEMDSYLMQLTDSYIPTEMEKSYLGFMRKSGQDPKDFPLAAYMLREAAKASRWQIARLVWQAAVGHSSGGVWAKYDAILEQIKDAITATDLTVQTLNTIIARTSPTDAAGAGETAAVDAFEAVWDALPEAVKNEGVNIYCSPAMARLYARDYRNFYRQGATVDPVLNRPILDVAGEDDAQAMIISVPEMGSSQRIIATSKRNLYYTYDMEVDFTNFNIQELFNTWYFWSDFRIGSGVHHANDAWMAVNELA